MKFSVNEVDKETTVWGKCEAIQKMWNVQTHFGIYLVATLICPVCGCDYWKYLWQVTKRDTVNLPEARQFLAASFVRCRNCKVVYQQVGPIGYRTYPHALEEDDRDGVMWECKELNRSALTILLARYYSRTQKQQQGRHAKIRLLDVGCSTGGFIEMALKQDIECEGIEIKPYGAEVARSRTGAKIHVGNFVDHQFDGQYDIVNCTEVIEHILSPTPFIKKMSDLLRSGGMLHLTTMPNSDSLRVRKEKAQNELIRDTFSHFVLYNPSAMRFLLTICGFDDIRFHAFPRRFATFKGLLLGLLNRLGHWDNQLIVTAFKGMANSSEGVGERK